MFKTIHLPVSRCERGGGGIGCTWLSPKQLWAWFVPAAVLLIPWQEKSYGIGLGSNIITCNETPPLSVFSYALATPARHTLNSSVCRSEESERKAVRTGGFAPELLIGGSFQRFSCRLFLLVSVRGNVVKVGKFRAGVQGLSFSPIHGWRYYIQRWRDYAWGFFFFFKGLH